MNPFRPWLLCGLTALVVARPLFPSESAASCGDGLAMVMLWIALAVFWLLGVVGRSNVSIRFGWTDAAVALLIFWHTVAALWAVAHGSPRPAVNMLWEWVGMGLCFFMVRQLVATPREVRALAAVMVALAVALSGYGLYQYAYEMPQTRAKYAANPDRALRDAGLWFPPGSPERKLFEDRLQSTEPIATFALTNSLAGFLAPWLAVLAGMIVSSVRSRKRLWGMFVCFIPIAVCLLLTKSRGGYVAVCVGLLLAWLLCRQRRVRVGGWKLPAITAAALAAMVVVAVAAGGLDREVLSQASKSFGYRLQYWRSSLRMIADRPWVGCGPGNFQNVYTQYKLPEASEEIADPHNFLLEIWATAGTPALLAFLAVLGCFAWTMWRGEGREAGDEGKEKGQPSTPSSESRSPIPEPRIPIPEPPIPKSSFDAWRHVLAGGALGFLLSLPLGMLSAAPPGVAAVLLGLPLAAAATVLLLGWIRDGRLPRLLPVVGVAALLVDLLVAGGVGLPSVAGTFWLLLALGLQRDSQGGQPREFRNFAAWAALVAAIVLAVACYRTAYSPVLGCQAQLRLSQREPARAVEHLEAAAAADPLSAEPWRRLAATEFEAWRRAPSKAAFDRFEQANARALQLVPNSAPAWLASGDWFLEASSQTDRGGKKTIGDAIDKAVAAYRQAVRLYPNNALSRAKLAEAFRAAGDRSAFRQEAKTALWLDETTPHTDKKLPAELRNRLSRGLRDNR